MLNDRFGNALSTHSQTACDHYTKGLDTFLAAGVGAEIALEHALNEDPDFGAAQLALAVCHYNKGRGKLAREALTSALATDTTTPFEQGQRQVMAVVIEGRSDDARRLAKEHLRDHPTDPLVAGATIGVFGLIGFSGLQGREKENWELAESLAPAYGDDWWFLAILGFAQMEAGHTKIAEKSIERAMQLNARNAHGAHYKSHLFYELGKTKDGEDYLSNWMQDYSKDGLMHGHNAWHLALWALADGDINRMWDIVDKDVAPNGSTGPGLNILTDTAAIYYRAQVAGVTVPAERWSALSTYASKLFPKPGLAFADIHAALTHAMAGNSEALEKINREARGAAGDLVRDLTEVFDAFSAEKWADASAALGPILGQHERIGGSRAQRDLLEFAYTACQLRLGQGQAARKALANRRPMIELSGVLAAP